jgi:hypothetical protein
MRSWNHRFVAVSMAGVVLASACSGGGGSGDEQAGPTVDVELTRVDPASARKPQPGGSLTAVLPPGPDGTWLMGGQRWEAEGRSRAVVWRSADGVDWESAELDTRRSSGNIAVTGMARSGERTVVIGGEETDIGSRPMLWLAGAAGDFGRIDGDLFSDEPDTSVHEIAGAPEGFVAAGSTGVGADRRPRVWTSTDGRTWTEVDALAAEDDEHVAVESVAFHAGAIVVAAAVTRPGKDGEDAGLWLRPAVGAPWERLSVDRMAGSRSEAVHDVTFVGGEWVASGHVEGADAVQWMLWRSPDARTWEAVDYSNEGSNADVGFRMYRGADSGDRYLLGDIAENGTLYSSADGRETWDELEDRQQMHRSPDVDINDVAVAGTGDLLAISGPDAPRPVAIRYRPGSPSTEVHLSDQLPPPTTMRTADGVAEANGHFYAWGPERRRERATGVYSFHSTVWASTDGRTWKEVEAGEAFDSAIVEDLVGVKEGLLAVGTDPYEPGGTTEGLPDPQVWHGSGSTWERPDLASSFPENPVGSWDLESVVPGGPGWIGIGTTDDQSAGLDGQVWSSVDGRQWRSVPAPALGGPGDQETGELCTAGSGLVAVGNEGQDDPEGRGDPVSAITWTSPDGVTWERSPIGSTDDQSRPEISACATTSDGVLAVGVRTDHTGARRAAAWLMKDGRTWKGFASEAFAGDVTLDEVAADGRSVVVVGERRARGRWRQSLWASDDAGTTWRELDIDERVLEGRIDEDVDAVLLKGKQIILTGHVDDQPAIWHGELR